MGLLEGKVAFITGGASGIGKGTALRFAEEGAFVAIADLQADEGEAVRAEVEKIGGRDALFAACDISDAESVKAAVGATVEKFGRLDVVFANAGINGVWAPLEDIQPDEWDRTFDINLKGTYLTLHFAIPHLRTASGGSVIITSSVNGNRSFTLAGASAYSASKAGQVALMKMAALELARYNIRVNAICPGAIRTNIGKRTQARNLDKIPIKIHFPDGLPAINGGFAEPKEVADTCLFLASDLSRHISGVEIYVDGGASLAR